MIYQVCIPHTLRDYFDYLGDESTYCLGARVWVPFRQQRKLGIIVGKVSDEAGTRKLKMIEECLDRLPLLDESMLKLCRWMSAYYQSPLSEVLPLAIPKKYRLGQACQLPVADYYQLNMPLEEARARLSKQAKKKLALIEFLHDRQTKVSKRLLAQQGFNSSHLLGLLSLGLITLSQEIILPEENSATSPCLELNAEQAQAVSAIQNNLQHYRCFLLQGVTGSGKTEVYLQIIAQVLAGGRQVLVLVPEIGLTPQLLSRFTARFKEPIALIHSNLNESERQVAWQMAKENKVKMIIGTRAAIFTPMPKLGLIVIDEEHDSSLKQMEGVRYSARDTALMRAHLANIPVVLGSATPSLESIYNCQQNKYNLLALTQKALSTTPLHYQLIDLRSQQLQQGLAPATLKLIASHLSLNNQVLVFINRRGFSPIVLCHQCGWMTDCEACDSHLTWHRQLQQMICHHCGLVKRPPSVCPKCKSRDLIPVGAGTQRIHEFLSQHFAGTRVLRIDRDEVRKKHAMEESLNQIHRGEAQLIVGTQMLAKGHHFPKLTLVVVLDADAGLYNQDFRALEHLGQLLTQVAGRAGREKQAGQVVIQTHEPNHSLLNVLIQQGYEPFAQALLTNRRQAQLPPFHYLAVLRSQSKFTDQVLQFMLAAKAQLQNHSLIIMGPAPAPLARKAHQHRMQLLIKSHSRPLLQTALVQLRQWIMQAKIAPSVRWNIDVDPIDLS